MKTFFIKTLGCKVNQCDSEDVRQTLLSCGWRQTREQDRADIRIVNTCCVTQTAERKSRQAVRQAAFGGSCYVFGCYGIYGKAVLQTIEGVRGVFRFSEKKDFLKAIHAPASGQNKGCPDVFSGRTRAFLKVQDGCNHRCSYCVIPLLRGRSRSLRPEEILRQARRWADSGHKEIVLTGINLGSFGRDLVPRQTISALLKGLEKVSGLERIRLSSLEVQDVTMPLLEIMASSAKVCPHLHLPFQSGADSVLTAMNRPLKVSDYMRIVDLARKKVPELAITCDMIAGFPTETDRDVRQTLAFLDHVRPLKTHVFPFSSRSGTEAGAYQVLDPKIVQERTDALNQCAQAARQSCLDGYCGKILNVLFETKEGDAWKGHSREYVPVKASFFGRTLKNQVKDTRISRVGDDGVFGEILPKN